MSRVTNGPVADQRRFLFFVILASIVLSLPPLFSGFMADDYFFTGGAITPDAPFGYYNFTEQNIASEIQQWWTSPNFKVRFFRPLSSLALYVDFTLLKGNALLAHLHSMVWFVLLLIGAHRVYRSLLSEKTAKWATALFSVSVIHAWNAGWIASRHTVMGGALTVFAAYWYIQWRHHGRRMHGILSATLFVLGLMTSEVSLSFLGIVVSYEMLFSKHPISNRLAASWWVAAVAFIYLIFYIAMGYGAAGSDLYTSPLSQPAMFCRLFVPKLLGLAGALVLGVPASFRVVPGLEAISLGAGSIGLMLLTTGVAMSWKRLDGDEKRAVKGLSLMAFCTLFPAVAGIAMGREFALTGMAVIGVIALVLKTLFTVKGPLRHRAPSLATAIVLFIGVGVITPLSRIGMGLLVVQQSTISKRIGESDTGCPAGAHAMVFTGGVDLPIAYGPHFVATHQGKFFKSWHQMVLTTDAVTIARPSSDRLVLSAKGTLATTLLLREKDNPLAVGDVIERRFMTIEVLETGNDGPTKIQVTFKSPRGVADICALKTEDGVLKSFPLPDVGTSVTVPYTPSDFS